MAITDAEGNKLPQPKLSKRVSSAKFRGIASNSPRSGNAAENGLGLACIDCGFKIRSAGHDAGAHHNGRVHIHRR